tara:strand:+ start:563 stop:1609 length:1047 start_codon:yes stop_codon:yes gene_type:complete
MKKSVINEVFNIPEKNIFIAFKQEDFETLLKMPDNHDLIVDCITSDIQLSTDIFDKIKNKYKKVISSNILINDDKHILWDCKIDQLGWYIKRKMFFNHFTNHNVKFLRLKNFLFLANHIRFERIEIFEHLCNENLLDNGLINFPSLKETLKEEVEYALLDEQKQVYLNYEKEFLPLSLDFVPKVDTDNDKKHVQYDKDVNDFVDVHDYGVEYNPLLYMNCYFEIVSETYYYTSEFECGKINHISEKTLKPIVNLLPHFCLTQKNYYLSLNKQLDLTFDSEIFNPIKKFDSLSSGKEKTKVFIDSIDYLLKMDRKDLHRLYVDALRELEVNQQKVLSHFSEDNIQRYLQ